MNNKAEIEISLKTIIGFVLVGILFFAFIGFFVKLWGIFLNNPTQATTNSFDNLVYELNTLEDGEEKTVPFYVQPKLYLKVMCDKKLERKVENDICICRQKEDCEDRLVREPIKNSKLVSLIADNQYIEYDEDIKVMNLRVYKLQNKIEIRAS